MSTDTLALARVPGFESTHYALADGRIVWTGETAHSDHPRNLANPWQAKPAHYQAQALRKGAALAWDALQTQARPGLLAWLGGEALPFPLNLAAQRLDDLAQALHAQNLAALEAACLRLLGLGVGLTPSGDDLVGAVFFSLRHAPIAHWHAAMPALHKRISRAASSASPSVAAVALNPARRSRVATNAPSARFSSVARRRPDGVAMAKVTELAGSPSRVKSARRGREVASRTSSGLSPDIGARTRCPSLPWQPAAARTTAHAARTSVR